MKILNLVLYATVILLILSGCNDEDKVTNPPDNAPVEDNSQNNVSDDSTSDTTNDNNTTNDDNNTTTENDATNDSVNNQEDESMFNFTSFDLDIEYSNNKDFDVDYENERDGMEAEIKDNLNNEKLSGDEAFERLKPIFEKMTFNKDTDNAEVISEVLNAFNLNDDYVEFELEVKFLDGTEKEYNN
ncbi:YusW family protein [Ornithinibacillus halotolerans]|uniref:YusW-like protein n=1 Tax=Ornithinibacillus halotolerans TaxID=1274357 RepID=A0A916RU89_9BACI|nr:YusW family protein [Ornithinibacillus halotolerans]GGA71369.1 hypothetical protein GCM10008025_14080 [Ornithinibacillus halotolerans]